MKKLLFINMIFLLAAAFTFSQQLTADEIIKKMDQAQKYNTAKMTGSIITSDRFGKKQVDFISFSNLNGDFLIEFTSSAEVGQKILRSGDIIYLYFPDSEELMRLEGSALRQSMLGSDVSYEDMTEDNETLADYTAELMGEEVIDEVSCWKISLTAKKNTVAYPKRIVWIQKNDYLPVQEYSYSKSEKLLKEIKIPEYKTVNGLSIPVRLSVIDKLKKDSSTEMIVSKVDLNIKLDPKIFTQNYLGF